MATKTSGNGKANGKHNRLVGLTPAPTAPAAPEVAEVSIPRLRILTLKLPIRGLTPLLMCRFDEKVRAEMEARTEGKASNKKAAKDPEREWNAARWLSTDGWDGIHAGGIRAAIIDAARSVEGLTMTALKQGVFVVADGYSPDGAPLVRIVGKAERFSNMCRTTTGVAYPRHRPIYKEWGAVLTLQVNEHILSRDAAVNLVNIAGFTCGLGEWRPTSPKSRTGDFGRFAVVTGEE